MLARARRGLAGVQHTSYTVSPLHGVQETWPFPGPALPLPRRVWLLNQTLQPGIRRPRGVLPGPELTQPGGDGLGSRPPRWDQDSCVPMTAPCQPPASLAAAELLLQPDLPSSRKHVHGTVLPTLAPPSPALFVHGRFVCLKPWWLLLPLPWVGLVVLL